jgi:hypothetical protein
MESSKINKVKAERISKHSWKGVDIIGHSGFGITNLDAYLDRNDIKENLRKVKKSRVWKNLTGNPA